MSTATDTSSPREQNGAVTTRIQHPGWSEAHLDEVLAEKKLTVQPDDKVLLMQIMDSYREEIQAASVITSTGSPAEDPSSDPVPTSSSKPSVKLQGKMMAGRKPQPFDPATMDIRTYIRGFELYKRAANLSDEEAIYAFMTYLDIDCQGRLERRYESESETWTQFKEAAMEILDGPYTQSPLDARLALKGAKQRAGETVQDFGERIRRLGEIGFSAEIEAREANMRDALVAGVLLDQIGVHLIQVMTRMTYDELLQEAKRLERSYKSRQIMNSESFNIEVSAMPARVFDVSAAGDIIPQNQSNFPDQFGTTLDPEALMQEPAYNYFSDYNY